MWLVDVDQLVLCHYDQLSEAPPFAALSHSVDEGDVTFDHLKTAATDDVQQRASFKFLLEACEKAREFGVGKIWADFACINPSSGAALSEALNSRFQIYHTARVCIVHLNDVQTDHNPTTNQGQYIRQSKWCRSSWMLQELIAPKEVHFFDKEWTPLGTKTSLLSTLSGLLSIDEAALQGQCLSVFSIARRMSWAARLKSRQPEDAAYSLIGIFQVYLPIQYGEGQRAFQRLQELILEDTDDASIFGWRPSTPQRFRGLLAYSPSEFSRSSLDAEPTPLRINGTFKKTAAGIVFSDIFAVNDAKSEILLCLFRPDKNENTGAGIGIPLRLWNGRHVRHCKCVVANLKGVPNNSTTKVICVRRDVDSETSRIISMNLTPSASSMVNALSGKKRDVFGIILNQESLYRQTLYQKDTLVACKHPSAHVESSDVRQQVHQNPLTRPLALLSKVERGVKHANMKFTPPAIQNTDRIYIKPEFDDTEYSSGSSTPPEDETVKPSSPANALSAEHFISPLEPEIDCLAERSLVCFSKSWSDTELGTPMLNQGTTGPSQSEKRPKRENFDNYAEISYATDSDDDGIIVIGSI